MIIYNKIINHHVSINNKLFINMGGCPSNCEVKCGNGFRYEGSTLELNFEQ